MPLKCILVWGKAEQDDIYCSSRRSQELTNVFCWKQRKKRKGKAFVAKLKLAEITLVFVASAVPWKKKKKRKKRVCWLKDFPHFFVISKST